MAGRVMAAIAPHRGRERPRRPDRDPARRRDAAARRRPRGLGASRPRGHPLRAPPGRPPGAVRREHPARDRGLEPPPAAARLAARRRRGERRASSSASATWMTARSPARPSCATPGRSGPWERVRRRFHVFADRRGVFTLGPWISRSATRSPGAWRWSCAPARTRSSSGRAPSRRRSSSRRTAGATWSGPAAVSRRIRPGSRACARTPPAIRCGASTLEPAPALGAPVTKRFEPSRDREVLIALDVQTAEGAAWEAAGLTTTLSRCTWSPRRSPGRSRWRRVAFGILAAGYTGAETRIASRAGLVRAGPGGARARPARRLSSHASTPFERLLVVAARTVRPGTTVLVLTARDPRPFVAALRRLERAGADVVVVACGRGGA